MDSTLCKQNRLNEALGIFDTTGSPVDCPTYVSILQTCIQQKSLADGKLIHAHINQTGFAADRFLRNTLLNMYVKCGSLADSRRVFDQITQRNVCSWTVMIAAYARHGFPEEALILFHRMKRTETQPNHFTFASVLAACANLASLEQGMDIHKEIIRGGFQSDVVLMSALVGMYAKCASIKTARDVFDKIPKPDAVSWSVIIAAYARDGVPEEALSLFRQMKRAGVQPNQFIFASVVSACANLVSLEQGVKLHKEIRRNGFESDVVVANALVDMYGKCGSIEKARQVFDNMHKRDLVSWNAMVAGYAHNGFVDEALKLFDKMPEKDAFSWTTMIAGFAQNGLVDEAFKLFNETPRRNLVSWNAMLAGFVQNGFVDEALKLFQEIPQRDLFSWTTMISGFAQSGLVDDALKLFKEMPQRCLVSWNAIIAGFVQNGHGEEALQLFQDMQLAGVRPNLKTFVSILPACSNLAALEQGIEIHEKIIRSGFQFDVVVLNALIDMYAKCGCLEKARELFDKMHSRNVVSWTVMIAAYAMHGYGKDALKLFEQMENSGTRPNHVTFVCVLSACSHAGLVDDGYRCFNLMSKYYHITPAMEHYSCMVDLLGRVGHMDEALHFINTMPTAPDAAVWSCLLGACRIHNKVELGETVANHIFELDSKTPATYVLLSNIYAAAGKLNATKSIRKLMKDSGVKKTPGCSWIEVNKQVHAFHFGDRSHPQMNEIYTKLERLTSEIKMAGYVPEMKFLNNVKVE
jgi:pentatricopeptide repeat protein